MPTGRPGADRAPAGGVLEEQLGPIRVVDERVHVPHGALLDPRVARALVGHTGAPHLGRLDREQQLVRLGQRECLEVARLDEVSVPCAHDAVLDGALLDAVRPAEPDAPH